MPYYMLERERDQDNGNKGGVEKWFFSLIQSCQRVPECSPVVLVQAAERSSLNESEWSCPGCCVIHGVSQSH